LLGAGAELGTNGNQSDLVLALQRGSQESINQSGQQLVRRWRGYDNLVTEQGQCE